MVVPMKNLPTSPAVPIPSATILGNHMRAARLRRGLTQRDLAKQLPCSLRWVTEVENGKETAQIGKVFLLCQFLGLKLFLGYPNGVTDTGRDRDVGADYPDLDTIMGGDS